MKRYSFLMAWLGCAALLSLNATAQAPDAQDADAQMPAGHPPVDAPEGATQKPVTTVVPSDQLKPDTIQVYVVNEAGERVPNADILLGIMKSDSSRDKVAKRADDKGSFLFTDLATGAGQAYRISVPYQGATFAAKPFRLEGDKGVYVTIVRSAVTHDPRYIVIALGQLLFEFRDTRVHVTQQARLVNLGQSTYVLPSKGLRLTLPKGFTAFQAEAVMSDQRINSDEHGMLIEGSIGPGETTLTWGYDIPVTGNTMRIEAPLGFQLYRMRVLAEAPEGLSMKVDGFPDGKLFETEQHRVLLSEFQRSPGDAPLESLSVTLSGLPGPGPARWVAVSLALLVAGSVLFFSLRKKQNQAVNDANIELAKQALLDQIVELDKKHAAGEIGPSYHAKQVEELTIAIALLLRAKKS